MNTRTTRKFVDDNKVKTVKADKTGDSPDVDQLLVELGNKAKSIPFYAVYLPGRDKPITLDGPITGGQITDALKGIEPETTAFASYSFPVILGLAFIAGLILNVMPCVLPVIGLKIMSFVQQGGESRLRVFGLNLWFSLGLLFVFWVLATIPVVLSTVGKDTIGWGGQFSYAPFSISLIAVVFVFALSFLGVWEVPIPGFAGGNTANKLAQQEGYAGAFTKGILATVLATPCTGPFLGPALGWAVAQPPLITYMAFTAVGLGMASPYLLIGIFPKLISFLPKPGAWMDTFKQVMGYVLLGTAVWIFTFLNDAYFIQTYWLLLALGVACWIIGLVPLTAELPQKARAWVAGLAIVGLVAVVAFVGLPKTEAGESVDVSQTNGDESPAIKDAERIEPREVAIELPWQPFSRDKLDELRRDGKTVLVDFTADS